MRQRLSTFNIRLLMAALCALMLVSSSLHTVYAAPGSPQHVPEQVGRFGEAEAICDEVDDIPMPWYILELYTYYEVKKCDEALARLNVAYDDAYREAEAQGLAPGWPTNDIHPWLGMLVQDLSGSPIGDGWGALISYSGEGASQGSGGVFYVGGSIWRAYERAVNTPSVLGDGIFPGYPTGLQHQWNRVIIQDFSGGSWGITAIIGGDQETAWVVAGNHLQAYIDRDGSNTLGNPRGPVELNADGWYEQKFEDGTILERAGKIEVDFYDESDTPPELPPVGHEGPTSPPVESSGGAAFHLPWEQGSVWRITVGNGEGEHANAANHHGFDAVAVPGRSTNNVTAVADGTVMDFQESMPDTALVNSGHAGNCVILDHGGGVYSLYAHLAQDSVPLSKGQFITSGTVIGTMGNSGFSTGPHLHWAVLNDAWMYTDASVSPYSTCSGRTIESRYADPDKELQEDGGIPRTGRYYESFNLPNGTSAEPANVETSVPTETTEPTQVIAPTEDPVGAETPIDSAAMEPSGSGFSDVAIVTMENGQPAYDACYILVGYGNEGCDDNGDGKITFEDIPLGSWTVRQTADLGPNRSVTDFTIQVTGAASDDGWERFPATITPVGSTSSGSMITSGSNGSGEATLLMTFRGCPEGFDPNSGDFWAECTVPLDAPDASIISWGGDGQGGMSITQLDRQYNGEYVYDAGPSTMTIQISGLAPVVRNAYQVIGADGGDGSTYTVNLVDGETREIFVFYWFA